MSVGDRGLSRFMLVMLTGLIAVSAPQLASAATFSALKVLSVAIPVPPGAEPNGQMSLQATAKANIGFGSSTVSFYLAQNPYPEASDILIGSASASLLPLLFAPGPVSATGTVPSDVTPGFYYLLACAGANNCAASKQTITIAAQELSRNPQEPGVSSQSAPGQEFFPESTPGMSVGTPFNCPASGNGQSGAQCVWVTTQIVSFTPPNQALGLFYCPTSYPYPFQVIFGHDTLWKDLSAFGAVGHTTGVSFTKYKTDSLGFVLSFAGPPRGYAVFSWTCLPGFCGSALTGQVQYACANVKTVRAIP
ncbi:MAG TPA: hypothetical protein VMA09_23620 [Candidatus Binataceae bacterium]|nr:hypothetical protein [Candidatus Binataceae bacterium]